MNHPVIDQIERTGYPKSWKPIKPEPIILSSSACDVCNEYEAEIKYIDTLLCSECCKDVKIKIL